MITASFSETVLSGSLLLALPIAALAGLVSFASPCIVPLIPGYVALLSGTAGQTGQTRSKPRLALGVLLFVLGFTAVFVLLGVAVSSLGFVLGERTDIVVRVLGVVVIVLGMGFMGAIPFLQAEKRVHLSPRASLWGAPLLGVVFGLGWTPCIGPTLAAVLTLGLSDGTVGRGALLAVAYCLGLGIPFFVVALWLERSGRALAWMRRHRLTLMRIGGGMLIILGALLVTGLWQQAVGQLQGWIDGFWVAI